MANSNYLIGLNVDTYMTSSFLQQMKVALDLPYVGMVVPQSPAQERKAGRGTYTTPEGVRISLRGPGSCHCFGMRAEVWDELGGWNDRVQTTASDGGFVHNIVMKAGLFTVAVEGTIMNEMFGPEGAGNPTHISSAEFAHGDNNIPPIFGIPKREYNKLCDRRREKIWKSLNVGVEKDRYFPTPYNAHFGAQELGKLFTGDSRVVDWEFAEKYGMDKWKDQVIRDFGLDQ